MERIAAEVHQRAAAECRVMAQLARTILDGHREIRADRAQFADGAGAQLREDLLEHRMEPVMESLHQRPAVPRRCLHHPEGFAGVHCERLFAQYSLAGVEGGDGQVSMPVWGQGIVDEVDVRPRDERLVAFGDLRNGVLVRVSPCPPGVPRRDADDLAVRPLLHRLDQCKRRDFRRAENSDAYHLSLPLPRADPRHITMSVNKTAVSVYPELMRLNRFLHPG